MKFNHPYHKKILFILQKLNIDLFVNANAYFGGGTQLTLKYGEYRWSKDIDFVCPTGPGYRLLRSSIFDQNYDAVFSDFDDFNLPRDIKADQYGIRFPIEIDNEIIKFEIFNENRIILGKPDYPVWSPVPCLNLIDSYAEKLLANADRWADIALMSRDLIDLCVIRKHEEIPEEAIKKASDAYPVIEPLIKAITNFHTNTEYQKRCFDTLQITNTQPVIIGLDKLLKDFG